MPKERCKDGNGNDDAVEGITVETTPFDPRFAGKDQALACFTYYVDYYRCMDVLKGDAKCEYLKKLFTVICPYGWVQTWDERREAGNFQHPIYRVPADYCAKEDLKKAQKAKKKL